MPSQLQQTHVPSTDQVISIRARVGGRSRAKAKAKTKTKTKEERKQREKHEGSLFLYLLVMTKNLTSTIRQAHMRPATARLFIGNPATDYKR